MNTWLDSQTRQGKPANLLHIGYERRDRDTLPRALVIDHDPATGRVRFHIAGDLYSRVADAKAFAQADSCIADFSPADAFLIGQLSMKER